MSIHLLRSHYDSILSLMDQYNDVSECWSHIASHMNQHMDEWLNIYHDLSSHDQLNGLELDYQSDLSTLKTRVQRETNDEMNCSNIISTLHRLFYDLMAARENYTYHLTSDQEMVLPDKHIDYYLRVYKQASSNDQFLAFCILFALESVFTPRFYVSIDLEYTRKVIQLIQLAFEHSIENITMMTIASPDTLTPDQMRGFIHFILLNARIRKILHGSDAQDIPYLFNQVLGGNKQHIQQFAHTIIDTRFLCEYYQMTNDATMVTRCALYDANAQRSSIFYFGLINQAQQDHLQDLLENRLPDHMENDWFIQSLNEAKIMYAQYDVIYLKYFYYRMMGLAAQRKSTPEDQKAEIDLYKHILNEMVRFRYLVTYEITNIIDRTKEQVNSVNIYFIRQGSKILKMIDIYNMVIPHLTTFNPTVNIDSLIKVGHFKAHLTILLKRLVYGHVSQKCHVYKDRANVWHDKWNNREFIRTFQHLKLTWLARMFSSANDILESRIVQICRR